MPHDHPAGFLDGVPQTPRRTTLDDVAVFVKKSELVVPAKRLFAPFMFQDDDVTGLLPIPSDCAVRAFFVEGLDDFCCLRPCPAATADAKPVTATAG